MISELIASNFRSLGPDVTIHPSRLTILVGPNGSGKSNLLDVLTFVRDATSRGLPDAISLRGGISSVRRRSHGRPHDVRISLTATIGDLPAEYGFELTGDKPDEYRVKSEWASMRDGGTEVSYSRDADEWKGPAGLSPHIDEQSLAINSLAGDKRFKGLVEYLANLNVYSIFPDMLRAPQKHDPARPMKRHGENWASTLREILERDAKRDLVAGLHKLTRGIEDVRVSSASGYLIAEFKQSMTGAGSDERWFGAGQMSDGTLRVAGLLTALLQEPHLPVIGIEEPELTVHPSALPMLYDYLGQASEHSQVWLSTHSPEILDVVDITRSLLLVVSYQNGASSVREVTSEQLEPVRQKLLSLGDLYLSGDLQAASEVLQDEPEE